MKRAETTEAVRALLPRVATHIRALEDARTLAWMAAEAGEWAAVVIEAEHARASWNALEALARAQAPAGGSDRAPVAEVRPDEEDAP